MKIINGELHNIFVSKCLIDERYRNKRVKFFWNEYLNQKSVTKIIGSALGVDSANFAWTF